MNCDELRPDYLLYALGTLEEPERGELRAHLDRGCESCTAGLREARAVAFGMGASVEGPAPPRQLRGRVLAMAGPQQAGLWSVLKPWAVAIALVFVFSVVLIGQAYRFLHEKKAWRAEIDRSNTEAAALREALAVIQAPDTREVTFGQGQPLPPRGRVFFHPTGVLLIAANLPKPPAGKTYEMWLIRGGKPAPAGLFSPNDQGNALHLFHPSSAPVPRDIVAVTVENSAGADAPTSAPIIAAPF
jgi:hypothetical protein